MTYSFKQSAQWQPMPRLRVYSGNIIDSYRLGSVRSAAVSRQFQTASKLPEGSNFSKVTVSACSFHSFWQRPSLALAVLASRIPDRPPQILSIRGTFRG